MSTAPPAPRQSGRTRRSENGGRSSRGQEVGDRSRTSGAEPAKTASELVKEAKGQIQVLDRMLQVKEPWDREIDATRNRIRACYKIIHFSYPTSSGAQSIDHLWIYTTHVIISRYRALIASLDKQLLQQESSGGYRESSSHDRNDGRRRQATSQQPTGPVEIRKVLTRFRSFLCSEQTFYRNVITSFVETFGLNRIGQTDGTGGHVDPHPDRAPISGPDQIDVDVQAYLEVVGIPVEKRQEDSHDTAPIQKVSLKHDEALKKVGLVHKALVCLGDLERYKEQYGSERDKQFGQSGRQGRRKGQPGELNTVKATGVGSQEEPGETYAKAKNYYEVARGLLPDNGNPSNQMAVIATYARDMFTAVYHYYRALACQQPFLTARQNLNKMLQKCLEEWRTKRQADPSSAGDDESMAGFSELDPANPLAGLKAEEVVLQAILITGDSTPAFENLVAGHAAHFGRLLADRAVPAEIIVKTVVMAITSHWDIRLREAHETVKDDSDHEGAAMWYLFNIAGVMLDVADQEVKDGLGPERLAASDQEMDVAIEEAQDDDDDTTALYPYITAVLRRLLPALRIFSKWLKANASLFSENSISQQEEFWSTYASFCRHLEALFPLAQLPELCDPLEEDFDMRGFSPLKRGMMEPRRPNGSLEDGSRELGPGNTTSDVHPNEEQLMRISDLLCDGKLIANYAPLAFRRAIQPASFASRVGMLDHHMGADLGDDRRPTMFAAPHIGPPGSYPLPSTLPDRGPGEESEFGDAVSISTATEDDPVNLAMRATLADDSSVDDNDDGRLAIPGEDEDDEDEDEEEIIWPNRQTRFSKDSVNEPAGLITPTVASHSSFDASAPLAAASSASTTRAHDLLHSLMTGSPAVRPSSQTSSPIPGNAAASPFSNTASPLLFGGVGFSSGASIWTRGVNEPNGEVERSRSGSGFARAGSVTAAHGLHGWASGPLEGNLIDPVRSDPHGTAQTPVNRTTTFPPPNSSDPRSYSPFG